MNNSNITNMLDKIDNISKQIKDEDYKFLLEQLKEIKEDYDKVIINNDNYFCKLSFKIKYNKIKHYDNDTPNHIVIENEEDIFNYEIKLSRNKIKMLSKLLNEDVSNIPICNCEDTNCSSNCKNIMYIFQNVRNMLKLTMEQPILIDMCNDCGNGDTCSNCCSSDEKILLNTINTCRTLNIILVNIEITDEDFIDLGDLSRKESYINKDMYFKNYSDTKPFNKYIDDMLNNIDNVLNR
jgi:hypothetical protein